MTRFHIVSALDVAGNTALFVAKRVLWIWMVTS